MKTISIPVNNRPQCLSKALKSIGDCVGHENWLLIMQCEPAAQLPDFLPCRSVIRTNKNQLGCRLNTLMAVRAAYEAGSDWNLYTEDDVILSEDALTLCDAFAQEGREGVLVLRRWHETQDANAPESVRLAHHGLLGNGFFYHRSLVPFLERWWLRDDPRMGGAMWDWSVAFGMDEERICQWRPMVNRSQNIGSKGTHSTSAADPNHFGECYKGKPVSKFVFGP